MRVLSISTDWNVFDENSAVARRQRMQASTLDRLDVYVPHGPRQVLQLAGNATMYGFGPGKFFGALRALNASLSLPMPDIVSAQDPFFIGFLAWIIARLRGSKLHLQVHTDLFDPHFSSGSFSRRIQLLFARWLLPRAQGIRVVSERIRKSLAPLKLRAPVSVLPVFVDIESVVRAETIDRRKLYPDYQKIILVVSRLEKEKAAARAISAFAEIHASQEQTGLVIVGDGSERESLKTLVRTLGLEKWVTFAGAQNPFSYYKAADVLLAVSDFEGYGMVIVEALAAHCPVVSLDIGVAREAGAVVVAPENIARVTVALLSEGKKGVLAFELPTEVEYRDMWVSEIGGALAGVARASVAQDPGAKAKIGYIGQGFIGKNYADDMERRGFEVVRYALEEPYRANKNLIKDCDIVFIAVPTPTTPEKFDDSIVREALGLVGKGKTAVIKSTIIPGTTKRLQEQFPGIYVMHSPEFLREATAAYDASHPDRNIVGIPKDSPEARVRANAVLDVSPPAPFRLVCSSLDAEIVKYAGNCWLYLKVVYVNLLYDISKQLGSDYQTLRDALAADPRIGRSHLDPVHVSGHGGVAGRGAGGHCLIKDFEILRRLYEKELPADAAGARVLDAVAAKNIDLLLKSGKDLSLVRGIYGEKPEICDS